MSARSKGDGIIPLNEPHDKISLASLSQSLIGLSHQALSFRKEVHGQDFLHDFYQEHLKLDIAAPDNIAHMFQNPLVEMERSYLRSWDIFSRES